MKDRHIFIYVFICMSLAAASLRLSGQTTGINLQPRVYLQGALHGLLPAATLMRDDLRSKGYLPTLEPYSALPNFQHVGGGGGEVVSSPAVFQATGGNAIVDWVVVELRSPSVLNETVATRSALLQRDGDVVGMDGLSPVNFAAQQPGDYRVIVRHRNHLGAMSKNVSLSNTAVTIDFADPSFEILNCGGHAMVTIGSKRALWGGDLNNDGRLIYQGPGNDVLKLFTSVLYNTENPLQNSNFNSTGYLQADTNLDGQTIYQGPKNDRAVILQFVLMAYFNVGLITNYVIIECIP